MARDQARLQRRHRNLTMVRDVMEAMRAMSALHYRAGSEGLVALRRYRQALIDVLAVLPAPALDPRPPRRIILAVMGANQGLCGAFHRRLVEGACRRLDTLGRRVGRVIVWGTRTYDELQARAGRCDVLSVHTAPSAPRGIPAHVDTLAQWVEQKVQTEGSDGVESVFMEHRGVGVYDMRTSRIFPVHARRRREELPVLPYAPRTFASPVSIARTVLFEWMYTELIRCALESSASEHGARLRTVDEATRTATTKLEATQRRLHALRQETITQEMQDLFGAMRHD